VRPHARRESISKRAPSSASARVAFIASSGERTSDLTFAAGPIVYRDAREVVELELCQTF